jgi:hypothetical protein
MDPLAEADMMSKEFGKKRNKNDDESSILQISPSRTRISCFSFPGMLKVCLSEILELQTNKGHAGMQDQMCAWNRTG